VKKMAVFVEGQTELLFVERLLLEITDGKSLHIVTYRLKGDELKRLSLSDPSSDLHYYVQIVDCTSDGRVKSAILERYDGLVSAGFGVIVGMRDVYPDFEFSKIPQLRMGLQTRLRTKPVRVLFVLAVMELEAWFLAEYTHFPRIHPRLTVERIKAALGFDASVDDLQRRKHPAQDLNNIYRLEGLDYTKQRANALRTVEALDWDEVYLRLGARFDDVKNMVECFEEFLSP
jgi:hypothetical protein